MKRLGIVAALQDEARVLTKTPLPLRQNIDLGNQVSLRVSGMGADQARKAGQHLIAEGAQALLSWGTAAALDPTLSPGTLVLAQEILSAEGQSFQVDPEWHKAILNTLAISLDVNQGAITESSAVLYDTQSKSRLFEHSQCVAVDMESAALAQLASEHALPFLSLRFIVDSADMTLPSSLASSLDADGQLQLIKLLGMLIMHPGEIPSLIKLGRAFSHTRKSMRCVLEKLGPDMGLNLTSISFPE